MKKMMNSIRILMMFALIFGAVGGAWAQLTINDVEIEISPSASGTISKEVNATTREVTLTITPASNYYILATDIIVEKLVNPGRANAPKRRVSGIADYISGKLYNSDKTKEISSVDAGSSAKYVFTLPEDYDGAYVTAEFKLQAEGVVRITSSTSSVEFVADKHYILVDDINASVVDNLYSTTAFTGTFEGEAKADGTFPTISGLSHALFQTVEGGTVRNVMFDGVAISSGNNVGAVANKVTGTSTKIGSIYNCGVLSGSISGSGYVGSIVGQLGDSNNDNCYARVINCFSYATVSGGSEVGGIVGYNSFASTAADIRTMVMNCMFYGDITGGSSVSPVYGGEIIDNLNGGLNNFNYYAYSQLTTATISKYNCALAVEEKYLNRFEFYRLLLNSNKKLAAFYATGSHDNADQKMLKWVLESADRTIDNPKPYPVLKAQGYYPSIINPDFENAPDSATVGRNKGGRLGSKTLSVTISGVGSNAPSGASITNGSLTLKRTDKDEDRFNFNYDKVQLPYYNDVGEGNYTEYRVVTGWKITDIKPDANDPYTSGNYDYTKTYSSNAAYFDYPNYNFADRKSSNKDKYSVSGRIFSQGAYFDVPYGVESITIEPYWGNAAYVADEYLDVVSKMEQTTRTATSKRNDYVAQNVEQLGKQFDSQEIEINGSTQMVHTSISAALGDSHLTGNEVYDNAVVLVGNLHQIGVPSAGNKAFTMMSVDLDKDNEPDYSLIYCDNNRSTISPLRFDFLNIPGMAQAQKPRNTGVLLNAAVFATKGWFEITNTAMMYFSQYEYETSGITKSNAPLILLGGYIDQFVSTQSQEVKGNTIYIHVGSNVLINSFGLGTHSDGSKSTPHVPVSVTGGDYKEFYLTGTYNQNATVKDDNAECYISGGRFGELAGAAQEQIGSTNSASKGNVRWQIYDADITDFFGGGVNDAKPVQGNITTEIFNSHVTTFCGGPKFGNMATGKTVTTTAEGCTFDKYFGAGYGGNSYSRKKYYDNTDYASKWSTLQGYYNTDKGKYFNGTTTNSRNGGTGDAQYGKKGPGVATDFDYEFFVWTSGAAGVRYYVKFVSFSLAQCNNVVSNLKKCTVNENFYGGGSLGKVSGTATSTLEDCTVTGNVFGAGYSATLPKINVRSSGNFGELPVFNSSSGMFESGVPATPTSTDLTGTEEYEWKHKDSYPANGSDGFLNDAGEYDSGGKNVVTTIDILPTNLGSVGSAVLTLTGNTTVGGNVYGGGEQSSVNGTGTLGNATVTLEGNTQVAGNLYGAGKGLETNYEAAVVKGNSTVTMTGGTVKGNIYGGGELSSVGNFTYDTTDPSKIATWTDNTGTATVSISGGTVGNSSDFTYTSGTTMTRANSGNVFAGSKGILEDSEGHYLSNWYQFAKVKETVLTINDGTIMSNIYGGAELGSVGYTDADNALVGGTTVTVYGGTIGTEIKEGNTTKYTIGSIFGGGYGSNLESISATTDEHAPKLFAGKVYGNTSVTMLDGTAKASVYGGGQLASVDGNATVAVSGGTVGVSGFGGATMGNVYGGGSGDKNIVRAGQIFGNTIVNISQAEGKTTTIYHNIYGGGAYGSVGTYTYHYTTHAPGYEGIDKVDGIESCAENTGTATVTITGGTIGVNGKNNGMVFGSSRGDIGAPGTRDDLVAWVSNANVTIGTSGEETGPTIKGSVYGSGENGHTLNNTEVAIHSGKIGIDDTSDPDGGAAYTYRGNVYGGGCGTDKYYEEPSQETYDGNGQLYNPKAGIVQGTTTVTIDGGYIVHNVYGAGAMGSVGGGTTTDAGKTTINVTGGRIGYDGNSNNDGCIFGAARGEYGVSVAGSNLANVRETEVNINYGTTPAVDDEDKTVQLITGSVFGGGEAGTVEGSVAVNMTGGLILKDVYGGGALADTQTSNWDPTANENAGGWADAGKKSALHTTIVRATGGIVKEEIYGGALGETGTELNPTGKPAYVWGDVLVDVNGTTTMDSDGKPTTAGAPIADTAKGCIVGKIFGCNNANGTPKGDVMVHVFATQNAAATQIANTPAIEASGDNPAVAAVEDAKVLGRYDVTAVYGGGNEAAYDPVTPYSDVAPTGSKTQVIIEGCTETSIETVYGGGNAAAVPETNVDIKAAFEIGYLFGGGNGKDKKSDGSDNLGADVGTPDHGTSTYGTGNANTLMEGGLIHEAYGGSNQKGIIKGSINQITDPKEPTDPDFCCNLNVEKIVGAGKYADIDGDVNMTLSCQPSSKVTTLFAGADEANVNGNITLNITNGHFGDVFGGNNLGGAIKGKITVNVEETGCQPIIIDNLYLGSNEAAYSVFGYYESEETHPVTGKKILKPRESADDDRPAVPNPAPDATHTFPYAQPELNIISCTYIGNVFGGGFGEGAIMYANPTVNVNMEAGLYADTAVPAMMTELGLDVTKTAPNPDKLGIIRNVFGGGNAADIVGNTTVNIAVEYVVKQVFVGDNVAGYYTRSGAGTTADPFVYTAATGTALEGKTYYEKKAAQGSAYIIGSVFGGGNAADVLGNTNVRMSDGYVFNGIFGGGYAGNVGTFTRSFADEDLNVFGHRTHEGCIGKPTACAEGTGKCTVVVDGGQIGPISVAKEGMNRSVDDGGPVPEGWVWGAGQGLVEDPAKEPDTHFKSYVGSTDVTIGGTAFVLESIIGGGEFGRVLGDTKVTITGQCQIGVGEGKVDGNNKPIRYTDDQFVNPLTKTITNDNALVECSHFPYGADTNDDGIKDTFLPYDPYYDTFKDTEYIKTDNPDLSPASTASPSDGKTWIGCVFAGGSGYMPYLKKDDSGNPVGYDWCSSAGLVEGNTELIISGGHILTNVYGGNEVTNVKGKCKITMTGGTIGVPRTVDQIIAHPLSCYLFGAGKGDQRPHFNTETNVQDVEIDISGGIIYGSVFGGGEDGHVQRDVNLTIEKGEDFTIGGTTYSNGPVIGTWGTSYVDGNVFGGGRGFGGDAYTAGNVAGSVDVKIKGGNILGSIYGGGRLGSVGYGLYPPTAGDEYYGAMRPDNTDDDAGNSPVSDFKRGYVDIEISGGTIGNRHEYIIPSEANTPASLSFAGIATWTDANWTTWKNHNNIPLTEFDKATYRLKHTKGGNVFAGGMGRLYQLDGKTPITSVDWWKLGCVKSTKLTIKGGTIKSCVYGGGELGQVVGFHTTQNAANEEISAGTEIIIQNSSTTTPTIGTEIQSGSGSDAATQYTFGSVFGGGYGSLQEGTINNEYPKLIAGLVKKDTKIDMKAGEVKASIYGGGEMASVGESTTSGETTTATGSTYVAVSGGTIGIAPITVGTTTRNFGGATMGNVYGGGSGHGNTVRSGKIFKNTNVTISGSNTRIYHNIYGGGAYGTVGDFDYTTNSDNKVTGVKKLLAPGTGVATVTITGGTIGFDGHENGMVFGSSRGDVNKPGQRDDYSAWVYDTFVTIGTQDSETGPAIKGSVYGSGENGHTFNDTDVKVHSGTIGVHDGTAADGTRGNVYGGGCGTDKYYSTSTELFDGNGDAYNPLAGIVQGTATVTINGGHVLHNVYGAGAMGPVGVDGVGHKTTVNINGGRIGYDGNDNGNVYGGARGDQGIERNFAYVGDTEVNINYTATPSADNEGKTEKLIAGSVFGGGEAGSVHGGIVVNMNKGLVLNDVYGGGALADTNTDNWGTTTWADGKTSASNTTAVNLTGGKVTGNVYGGGLGRIAASTKPAIEAKVYGNTTVELNKDVAVDAKGCIVLGSIFGCNNLNGTPMGDVLVHIHATQNDATANIETKTSEYDVDYVFGGGNKADYVPATDNEKQSTEVIIEGCALTSIEEVYGGGYGAATPGTKVEIRGTHIIDNAFGGGYGAGTDNPGANVGYRTGGTTPYGKTGSDVKTAVVRLMAGKVNNVYGGSNTRGDIRGGSSITNVDKTGESGDKKPCCDDLKVGNIYGGGKDAEMEGGTEIILGCMPNDWIEEIYAGAENADVGNDVSLTLTSGKFGRVFGGNKTGGRLNGGIVVNIEENGTCGTPIIIGELYGGGNEAPYSIYGYKNEKDANGKWIPREKSDYDAMSDAEKEAEGIKSKPHESPVVNVRAFTSIGNIYGGGLGTTAVMVGSPTVNINEVAFDKDVTGYQSNAYNPADDSGKPSWIGDGENQVKLYPHEDGKMGVIGNVFGGGNAARIIGNTNVNIGTENSVKFESLTDITLTGNDKRVSKPVVGADIRNNVYGGGNNAEVTGNTNVTIGEKKVSEP